MKKTVIMAVAVTLGMAALSAYAQESGQVPVEPKEKTVAAVEKAQPQPTQAQPPAAKAVPAKEAKVNATKFFGAILTIDEKEQKITVKSRKGESREFVVAEKTKLTKGGNYRAIQFSDIKTGDKVSVRLSGETIEEVHVNVYAKKKSEKPSKN